MLSILPIDLNFYIKQFFYSHQQSYIISTLSSLFLIIFTANTKIKSFKKVVSPKRYSFLTFSL